LTVQREGPVRTGIGGTLGPPHKAHGHPHQQGQGKFPIQGKLWASGHNKVEDLGLAVQAFQTYQQRGKMKNLCCIASFPCCETGRL
jgi:hypothetical protein